ncbi:hypothetical protein L873DRAFT_1084663 [Choiromyces venosus 120613-1]|uniref:Uncharacterized protein n=1 Tax=Choiromyces venosus 120613-1 TaxID=1336337 RepID=A0A3N4JL31_9PEZI|nr:hypothetical protein L873DRAFT_1084663 [Choiromyces venosus 120613-1]
MSVNWLMPGGELVTYTHSLAPNASSSRARFLIKFSPQSPQSLPMRKPTIYHPSSKEPSSPFPNLLMPDSTRISTCHFRQQQHTWLPQSRTNVGFEWRTHNFLS